MNNYKPVNKLSNLKTNNALVYVMAGLFRNDNKLDECFVLNQFGRIAECISSNIFLVSDNKIVTPPLTEGCISGIMREVIIQIATGTDYILKERGILEKDIINAEEIFITNAISGIQWVGAYKDRRYFNFLSRKFIRFLNESTFTI